MAEPSYTSGPALLLIALEAFLRTDPDTGKARHGLRSVELDASDQAPPAFPAALITPGGIERNEQQELTWTLSIALVDRCVKARSGILRLLDLEHQLVRDLLEHGELLADGWSLEDAWGGGVTLAARSTDPSNPKAGRDLFHVAVVTLTAKVLE